MYILFEVIIPECRCYKRVLSWAFYSEDNEQNSSRLTVVFDVFFAVFLRRKNAIVRGGDSLEYKQKTFTNIRRDSLLNQPLQTLEENARQCESTRIRP